VERVDAHDLGRALVGRAIEVAQAAEQVSDDDIAGDHRVGEDRLVEVLARRLEREHRLLLKVLEAHLL